MKNNIKKGAMFGLDARIALAIFGALSVISGAALYSAIQQAKVTAISTYFTEIAKAYESLYIDTAIHSKGCELLNNNPVVPGWKGPYYWEQGSASDCSSSTGMIINDPFRNAVAAGPSYAGITYVSVAFQPYKNSTWTSVRGDACTDDADCNIYYSLSFPNTWINGTEFNRLAALIDENLDGGDGGVNGNFRYGYSTLYAWHYRIMPK